MTSLALPAGMRCEQRLYLDSDEPDDAPESGLVVPLLLVPLLVSLLVSPVLPVLSSDDMLPPDDMPSLASLLVPDDMPPLASSPALWQAASDPATNRGNSTMASHRWRGLLISIFLVKN